MNTTIRRLSYVPQLDSFRFFAVLLVIFSHWFENTWINIFPNGFVGVTFFFVLSGFLISTNLLYTKRALVEKRFSFGHAIKTFYARRTLRIFPLYFVVIFLVFILAPAAFEGHLLWYVAYIPNFLIFRLHTWPGMLSHFWSLGVEEQFYLIWPVLVFVFPESRLRYLFSGIILLSIGFKMYMFKANGPFFNFYDTLPIGCFDAFGTGALLALFLVEDRYPLHNFIKRIPAWVSFSSALFICWLLYISGLSFLFSLSVSLVSFLLIQRAMAGHKNILDIFFDNNITRYLGKISYGLYVYHNFIPWLLRCVTGKEKKYPLSLPAIRLNWSQGALPLFIVHFILLLVIASISWFFMERPLNNLKKYFA